MTALATGKLGPESTWDLDVEDGMLVATLQYDGAQLDGDLTLRLDAVAILEILKTKIPGTIDDVVISLVEQAIKAQSVKKPGA